jgi:hypothetical protein
MLLNNGNATFAPAQRINMPCDWFDLGDLDADGDLDLLATGNAALTVALNDGQGRFTPQPGISPIMARMVSMGDADNDGDLDAFMANGTDGVVMYLNDGTGKLEYRNSLPRNIPAEFVALGDVDGDGDLDVAVGYNRNTTEGWLTTLVNDGTGRFTNPSGPVAAGRLVAQVLLADVDHDADLDLLALNTSSGNVSIMLNNGLGLFSASQSVALHHAPSRMAMGDFDGDGDLDLAAVQGSSSVPFIDIRLNESQALAAVAAKPNAPLVTVYPNPAHGQFVVAVPARLRSAAAGTPLRLYNAVGQLVLEQPLQLSAKGELTVDVAHLLPGLYTLHLPLRDGPATYKVVLE